MADRIFPSDKYRILVDWDGDGFFNVGVPEGTPANLIPNPYYTYQSNMLGIPISGREVPNIEPTVVTDVTELGAEYASFPCGGSNSKQVWIGNRPNSKAKPMPSDILSAPYSSLGEMAFQHEDFATSTGVTEPVVKEESPYGEYSICTKFGTLNLGWCAYYNPTGGTGASDTSFVGLTGLTPSTAYRLNFWYRVAKSAGSVLPSFIAKVFSNFKTLGVYNVLNSATLTSVSPSETFVKCTITFTTPSNVDRVGLSVACTNPNSLSDLDFRVLGVGVFPTASNPDYVSDPANLYDLTSFTAVLEANTAYNYSFYTKATSFTKVGVVVKSIDTAGTTWATLLSEQQTTINDTDWTRVNVQFTTGSNPCYVMLNVIPYVGASVASAGVTGTLNIRAVQLTKGTKVYPFHAGELSPYDVMNNYIVSASWKMGKRSIEELLPYEGVCELEVNNDSKIFSPSNTASPLYGAFRQNRKMAVQIKNRSTGEWSNLWVGWIEKFEATAGRNSDRRARIIGRQGVYRFREGEINVDVSTYNTFKTIVTDIIESGQWKSAPTAYEGVLDFNMALDENAFISDTNADFGLFQDGINVYNLKGLDWGRETTTSEALDDLLGAENAGLWIDRDGKLNVVNRNFYANRANAYDLSVNLDTSVVSGDYVYGEGIVNKAEVQYQPPKFNTNADVWSTAYPVVIKANGDRTLAMVFKFPEGRIKTVQNLQTAITKTIYTVDPIKNPTAVAVTNAAIIDRVSVTVVKKNNKFYLYISNGNGSSVYVNAVIKGDYAATGDMQAGVYQDDDSINTTLAIFKKNYSNPLISSEEQAIAVAQFMVSRNADVVGEFNSLKLVDDNTTAFYDLVVAMKQGAVLKVTETQTGEAGLVSMIVEESGSIDNGVAKYNVTLCKLDQDTYKQVGINFIDPPNRAFEAYPVAVRGAKVVTRADGLRDINTGVWDSAIYFIDDRLSVQDFRFNVANAPNANRSIAGNYMGFDKDTVGTTDGFYVGDNGSGILVADKEYYAVHVTGNMTHFSVLGGGTTQNQFPVDVIMAKSDLRYATSGYSDSSNLQSPTIGVQWWNYNGANKQLNYTPASPPPYVAYGFTDKSFGIEHRFYTGIYNPSNFNYYPYNQIFQKIAIGVRGGQVNSYPTFYTRWFSSGASIIKMSNLKNMSMPSSKTHKFALWAMSATSSPEVNWTLDILDVDHNVIATTTGNILKSGMTKLECSIPSGYSYATARLYKTSGNTERRNDRITLYGYALTETSLDSYTDIPKPTSLIYI